MTIKYFTHMINHPILLIYQYVMIKLFEYQLLYLICKYGKLINIIRNYCEITRRHYTEIRYVTI